MMMRNTLSKTDKQRVALARGMTGGVSHAWAHCARVRQRREHLA